MVALLVLINTALSAWVVRTTSKVHDAVNGMQAAKVSEAHQAGVTEGRDTGQPLAGPPTL